MPHGNSQGQVGQGSQQPNLLTDVTAHHQKGLDERRPLEVNQPNTKHSMVLWFNYAHKSKSFSSALVLQGRGQLPTQYLPHPSTRSQLAPYRKSMKLQCDHGSEAYSASVSISRGYEGSAKSLQLIGVHSISVCIYWFLWICVKMPKRTDRNVTCGMPLWIYFCLKISLPQEWLHPFRILPQHMRIWFLPLLPYVWWCCPRSWHVHFYADQHAKIRAM